MPKIWAVLFISYNGEDTYNARQIKKGNLVNNFGNTHKLKAIKISKKHMGQAFA